MAEWQLVNPLRKYSVSLYLLVWDLGAQGYNVSEGLRRLTLRIFGLLLDLLINLLIFLS